MTWPTALHAPSRTIIARKVAAHRAALIPPARPPALALLPHQTPPPGDWRGWLLLAGRGAGKTFAGAAWLHAQHARCPYLRIVAPTFADARDVCVEGDSGILAQARAQIRAWNRSLGELIYENGARIKLFSADEPDRLRGPQSGADWYDELAAWRYAEAALDMAQMGLRIGADPRYVATTTPRPIPIVRRLLDDSSVVTTRARTFDNTLLPEAFKLVILARYAGTRLGRQELDAELLEDTPGALWALSLIEATRVRAAPALRRIVVGVDPPASSAGAACGIVIDALGMDDHGYTLEDASMQGSPAEWGAQVIRAFVRHRADRIVAERNNGGEMVEHVIRSVTIEIGGVTVRGANLPITLVWASRGKATRAEPVSALYEQGRWHHVGAQPELETQMTTWVPGEASPDRMDAHVWAATELFPSLAMGGFAFDHGRGR